MKFFILTVILSIVSLFSFSQNEYRKLTYNDMQTAQDKINGLRPMMLDSIVRFDNCFVIPATVYSNSNMSLQYNCTITTLLKSDIEDINYLKSSTRSSLINKVKTEEDLGIFKYNNIIFIYNYHDKNGTEIFKIEITPEVYKN